jgi:hypothetical protein
MPSSSLRRVSELTNLNFLDTATIKISEIIHRKLKVLFKNYYFRSTI